jgi:rRNA-processing protein FCF1
MAVTLPPWLQIDPIAPARIRLAANAQRLSREQAARMQYDRLEAEREHQDKALAAQERAAMRHEAVLRQTKDEELARAAEQMQLRREAQAQRAEQFQQQLRLKEQAAEQAAAIAAKRMQGMQALQKGLQAGEPIEKLVAANAPLLFAGNEKQLGRMLPSNRVGAPPDFIAHELKDEQGNPLGVRAMAGAHGSVKPLPRTELTPEGRTREDLMLLNVYQQQYETAKKEDKPAIAAKRDALIGEIESRRAGRPSAAGAGLAPTAGAPVAPVVPEGQVRLRSPDGQIGFAPRDQWDATPEEEKKGWTELSAGKVDESAMTPEEETDTEETDTEDTTPEEE